MLVVEFDVEFECVVYGVKYGVFVDVEELVDVVNLWNGGFVYVYDVDFVGFD